MDDVTRVDDWGVRLELPGCEPEEFKIPAGKPGAEAYADAINMNAGCQMKGEKATVVTRQGPGSPWEEPAPGKQAN